MTSPAGFIKAAGILFISGGRVLIMRRAPYAEDAAQYWDLPGGKQEAGETDELTALRECIEETGHAPDSPILPIASTTYQNVEFTTFANLSHEEFAPTLNEEHTGYMWLEMGETPPDGLLHPGLLEVLSMPEVVKLRAGQMNELDVARAMARGALPSPQQFKNVALWDMRITGTGTSYRPKGSEYVFRPPENYLTEEMRARCAGLPVIWEHPENAMLDSEEYGNRNIGSVLFPYLDMEAEEVRGIARVYDDAANQAMRDEQLSTSPNVVFRDNGENTTIALDNGTTLLIEGKPFLLDHLAVCAVGVWDKGGPPTGITTTLSGISTMTPEELAAKADSEGKTEDAKADAAKADADPIAKLTSMCDSIMKRMDSLEAGGKAKADAAEDKEADKSKADADDKEADKSKADAAVTATPAKADDAGDTSFADAATFGRAVDARVQEAMKAFAHLKPVEVTDADASTMADAQARADSVAQAFGTSAPRPLQGERPLDYRKRLVGKFKSHSKEFKDIDLATVTDPALFGVIETRVYADALAAADHPGEADLGAGMLRERVTRDATGRQIRTFVGRPMGWMKPFMAPKQNVHAFNKE